MIYWSTLQKYDISLCPKAYRSYLTWINLYIKANSISVHSHLTSIIVGRSDFDLSRRFLPEKSALWILAFLTSSGYISNVYVIRKPHCCFVLLHFLINGATCGNKNRCVYLIYRDMCRNMELWSRSSYINSLSQLLLVLNWYHLCGLDFNSVQHLDGLSRLPSLNSVISTHMLYILMNPSNM